MALNEEKHTLQEELFGEFQRLTPNEEKEMEEKRVEALPPVAATDSVGGRIFFNERPRSLGGRSFRLSRSRLVHLRNYFCQPADREARFGRASRISSESDIHARDGADSFVIRARVRHTAPVSTKREKCELARRQP